MRHLLLFCLLCAVSSAAAETVETVCPERHGDARLVYAEMLHFGDAARGGGPDETAVDQGIEHHKSYFPSGHDGYGHAVLECTYTDKTVLRLPIPGILREHHVKLRELRRKPEIEVEFISVWAVSETGEDGK